MAPKRRPPTRNSRSRLPATPKSSTALIRVDDRPMFYGGPDPITLNRMESLVNNIRTMRQEDVFRGRGEMDPRRSINDECGYPEYVTLQDLKDLIDREPVAGLVNAIYPLECFKVSYQIWEDDDEDVSTPFEEDLDELPKKLTVEPSYYKEDKGNALLEFFLHLDMVMGYGRYGVGLIGINDNKDLSEPCVPSENNEVTFLRAFPEHLATITEFEKDRKSPRYGWPTRYSITFADPDTRSGNGINESTLSESVHWSRVVHVVDRWHHPSISPLFAMERLRPLLNPILDIRKVRGSSAEMYYKGAFFGLHFGTHPQLGPDVDVDKTSLLDMYEEYVNGLQRALFTSGMTVDPLAPQVSSPKEQIEVQLEAISIKTRIPKRKLMGSERGELSSADDRKDFNATVASRQNMHCTPRVIVPVLDRLINLKCLRPPSKERGYQCWWPDMVSESAKERADTLLVRTQAYGAAVTQGVFEVIQPLDYMTKFDSVPKEEAEAMLDATEQAQAEADAEAQAIADEHGLVPDPTDPTGTFRDPPVDPIEMEKAKAKARVTANAIDPENADAIYEQWIINCGGKGGTPGPCPIGDHGEAHAPRKYKKGDKVIHIPTGHPYTVVHAFTNSVTGLHSYEVKDASGVKRRLPQSELTTHHDPGYNPKSGDLKK